MTDINTPARAWIDRDPRRHAPEVDFGTVWTRETDPDTEWAVTWNSGTGELYAHSRNDIEVLGTFTTEHDVARALPDWARHAVQPGGLDWARRLTIGIPDVVARERTPHADVYGIVLGADGTRTRLLQPTSHMEVSARIGDVLDVVTIDRSDKVIMWVDDLGHDKHLPVNPTATMLYGTGWPIVGDVVITNDDQRPLPDDLVRQLAPDTGLDLDDCSTPIVALDWDDHLADRDRDYDADWDPDDWLSHHDLEDDLELNLDDGDIAF